MLNFTGNNQIFYEHYEIKCTQWKRKNRTSKKYQDSWFLRPMHNSSRHDTSFCCIQWYLNFWDFCASMIVCFLSFSFTACDWQHFIRFCCSLKARWNAVAARKFQHPTTKTQPFLLVNYCSIWEFIFLISG
jgi:hypothetical protein